MAIEDLLFVAFNRYVVALSRATGDRIWDWKAPTGTGFVTLLMDYDRLFASVQGYTYCLDPLTGQQLWYNPLKGYGTGVASLATVWSNTQSAIMGEAQAAETAAAAATSTGS
jgi:outer membrane protein assembly factor BamB